MLCGRTARKYVIITLIVASFVTIYFHWISLMKIHRDISVSASSVIPDVSGKNSKQNASIQYTDVLKPDQMNQYDPEKILGIIDAPDLIRETDELRPLANYILQPRNILIDDIQFPAAEKYRWSAINVVKSAVRNKYRRMAVRDTWGEIEELNGTRIKTVFILGTTKNQTVQSYIVKESEKYGDILQIDIPDDYEHVPDKVLAGMQWVSESLPGHWIYSSADDDIALHVHNFVGFIYDTMKNNTNETTDNLQPQKLPIICIYSFNRKDKPARDKESKWYMPKETYPPSTWPPYCRGGWYTMPVDTAKKLHSVSRRARSLYLDDVWITGILRIKMLIVYSNLEEKSLIDAGITDAPLALRNNADLIYGKGEDNLDKVLVSHVWGNIKKKQVNVANRLRNIWIAWTKKQPLLLVKNPKTQNIKIDNQKGDE
uniref:lactosylceramide 1,3-N-acetyl-beta-D-glucosaminyltransferase A-like isoform X2 n=1 Tax=Styela clava TaxID=7725 RepID=UPI0019393D60|nr:lactosylceramide 1,3-N-acetyl-beta-D-glucosaminyltransferase A-like isoform X2 [Styela clava]